MGKLIKVGIVLALVGANLSVYGRVVKHRAVNGSHKAQNKAVTTTQKSSNAVVVDTTSKFNAVKYEMTEEEKKEHNELVAFLLDLREKKISGKITEAEFNTKRQNELDKRRKDREEKSKKRMKENIKRIFGVDSKEYKTAMREKVSMFIASQMPQPQKELRPNGEVVYTYGEIPKSLLALKRFVETN